MRYQPERYEVDYSLLLDDLDLSHIPSEDTRDDIHDALIEIVDRHTDPANVIAACGRILDYPTKGSTLEQLRALREELLSFFDREFPTDVIGDGWDSSECDRLAGSAEAMVRPRVSSAATFFDASGTLQIDYLMEDEVA